MKKSMRTLTLSLATLAVASALVVGGSYALFSDSVEVNNHIAAGSLKVGLHRIKYVTNTIQANGLMQESEPDTTDVDLASEPSTLFSFDNAAPTTWAEATLKVSNLGNVAFDYGVKMLFNSNGQATPEELEFARQIEIKVTVGDQNKTYSLADSSENAWDMGSILVGSGTDKEFKIRATFIDDELNNDVQSISLDFDMQLYASQKVN